MFDVAKKIELLFILNGLLVVKLELYYSIILLQTLSNVISTIIQMNYSTKIICSGVSDAEKTRYEAIRFQFVFSQLPDEIQRVVAGFVPQIFVFTNYVGKLKMINSVFCTLERNLVFPRELWSEIHNTMSSPFIVEENAVSALPSREICKKVKSSYAQVCDASDIAFDEDDVSGEPWAKVTRNTKIATNLKKIHRMVTEYDAEPDEDCPFASSRSKSTR